MKQVVKKYDFVCLGGGPASLAAARRAIQYKKSVCIIESGKFGGVCLNQGCIPKKLLYTVSQNYKEATRAAEYGVWTNKDDKKTNNMTIEMKFMQSKIKDFVEMASRAIELQCVKSGIEILKGRGKFIDPTTIQLKENDKEIVVHSDNFLIATGSKALIPDEIKGVENVIKSDDLYELNELPESLLIIGSDYIGIESASLMNNFAVNTAVLMREKRILTQFDAEIANIAMEYMKSRGINFYANSDVDSIEKSQKKGYQVNTKSKNSYNADQILLAVGRKPNTKDMGLEEIGVSLGKKGEILVDKYDRTSMLNIYALGDVTGRSALATVAKSTGKILADRLFGPCIIEPRFTDYINIPTCVFCDPPIVKCGLTEQEAISQFGLKSLKIYKHQGYQLGHALLENKDPLMVKIITRIQNNEEIVIGIHGLGKGLEENVNGLGLAMQKGLTKNDLDRAVTIHPTVGEEFLNML